MERDALGRLIKGVFALADCLEVNSGRAPAARVATAVGFRPAVACGGGGGGHLGAESSDRSPQPLPLLRRHLAWELVRLGLPEAVLRKVERRAGVGPPALFSLRAVVAGRLCCLQFSTVGPEGGEGRWGVRAAAVVKRRPLSALPSSN